MSKAEDRTRAITAAKRYVAEGALFYDTETTGVDASAEICDIAFVDLAGKTVFESLVKPTKSIPAVVTNIHHITNEMVAEAPSFTQILDPLLDLCAGRLVVAYNMEFDCKMIVQSARAHGIMLEPARERLKCAMLLYAAFRGQWNSYRNSYKWAKLSIAAEECGIALPANLHRARVDADLGRQILLHMAGQST